jgi:hypothetical protein
MPDRFATGASAIRPTPDAHLSRFHWDRLANWVESGSSCRPHPPKLTPSGPQGSSKHSSSRFASHPEGFVHELAKLGGTFRGDLRHL